MRARLTICFLLTGLLFAAFTRADTVILHDGSSYSGQFTSANNNELTFTDGQGVQYRFPVNDVQSLVFTASTDIITLRSGKVYSGKFTGTAPITFTDFQGIQYQFPLHDIESIVFTRSTPSAASMASNMVTKIIPEGSDIAIHTDEDIDSQNANTGQLFNATVTEDIFDASGGVAIPRGSRAKLVIRNITTGGAVHTPELALDLFSVILDGKEFRVDTSDVIETGRHGVGANTRTAAFGGGGAAIGALLGGIFGGGRGAGIGAAAGAGGGLLTQLFTRGKQVKVSSDTILRFRLERTLVLRLSQ
jgi:hypothetical protein